MLVPPAPRPPAEQLAQTAAAAREVHRAVLSELERAVLRVRLAGGSWGMVAAAVGVSRAAAFKRWRYLDEWPEGEGVAVVRVADGEAVFVSTQLREQVAIGTAGVLQAAGSLRALRSSAAS